MTLDTADDDTRERIKRAAIRLFARQGIDGVSVRAILTAADVKNSAGIHYYFRTQPATQLLMRLRPRGRRFPSATLLI